MRATDRATLARNAGVSDNIGCLDMCFAGGFYLSQELAHVRAVKAGPPGQKAMR